MFCMLEYALYWKYTYIYLFTILQHTYNIRKNVILKIGPILSLLHRKLFSHLILGSVYWVKLRMNLDLISLRLCLISCKSNKRGINEYFACLLNKLVLSIIIIDYVWNLYFRIIELLNILSKSLYINLLVFFLLPFTGVCLY